MYEYKPRCTDAWHEGTHDVNKEHNQQKLMTTLLAQQKPARPEELG